MKRARACVTFIVKSSKRKQLIKKLLLERYARGDFFHTLCTLSANLQSFQNLHSFWKLNSFCTPSLFNNICISITDLVRVWRRRLHSKKSNFAPPSRSVGLSDVIIIFIHEYNLSLLDLKPFELKNFVMNPTTPLNEKEHFYFREWVWITDVSVSSLLALVSVYTIIALIYHKVKVQKRRESFMEPSTENKISYIIKILCIMIGFGCFFRNVFSLEYLYTPRTQKFMNVTFEFEQQQYFDGVCQVLSKAGIMCIGMTLIFVYLFLWFRQRIFYIEEMFKNLNNNITKITSCVVLALLGLGSIVLAVSYLVVVRYEFHSEVGCIISKQIYFEYGAMMIAMGICCVLVQVTSRSLQKSCKLPSQFCAGKTPTLFF